MRRLVIKPGPALLRFDGGARPTNPGHAAFAAVLQFADQEENDAKLTCSRYLGQRTNNYAEYVGLLVGVKIAVNAAVTDLTIVTDSQLVHGHITKDWQCKVKELRLIRDEVLRLLERNLGNDWSLEWERRASNTEADALCTAAINWGRNKNPFTPQHRKDKRGAAGVVEPCQYIIR